MQRLKLATNGNEPAHGFVTRGKTARNRLRRVDNFVAIYDPGLISRQDGEYEQALFVDLGYGAEPFTTLESADRLRRLNPALPVLGVEIDPQRVAAGKRVANGRTWFRLGSFDLPLVDGERVRLVRAFNVLRQYEEGVVRDAYDRMARHLLPGGLLIEGTSDPFGRLWVANLVRKTRSGELIGEGLLFSTNFGWGFRPDLFQPVLPKNLIHRMVPGEPIYDFFAAWKRAYLESLPIGEWGLQQLFVASAQRLSAAGIAVNLRPKLLKQGFLLWLTDSAFDGVC